MSMKKCGKYIFLSLLVFIAVECARNKGIEGSMESLQTGIASSEVDIAQRERSELESAEAVDPLVPAVQGIIEDYLNGMVDTETGAEGAPGAAFDPLPEDFAFPLIESAEDFERITPIEGSNQVIVYLHGTGTMPYANIRIDKDQDFEVVSVLFLFDLPE